MNRPAVGLLAASLIAAATAQSKPAADPSGAVLRIIEETNRFRREHALGEVNADARLTRAAEEFARYMARTGKYGHEADGREPAQRAEAHGYAYCVVLENIAYHYDSRGFDTQRLAHAAVEGWKHSPGHRKNMLNAGVTQTGVAVARAANGYYYEVQMFGRPRSASVSFEVRNESRKALRYRVGDVAYEVPAHAYRTHEVCSGEAVRFGGDGEPTTPRKGDRFVVPAEGGRPRLERR